MSYPHVRVAAPGRIEYFETASEFANAQSWTEREATGWVRTEGIEPEVIHASPKKSHLVGGWVRYDAEDQPILTNRVVYILTKAQSAWGVQARFACGATEIWEDDEGRESASVVKRFLKLLEDRNARVCAALVRYPFVLVGMNTVHRFETESSFSDSLRSLNLTALKLDDVSVTQIGEHGANIAVSFQFDAANSGRAVFLIDKRNSQHRIASVSVTCSPP